MHWRCVTIALFNQRNYSCQWSRVEYLKPIPPYTHRRMLILIKINCLLLVVLDLALALTCRVFWIRIRWRPAVCGICHMAWHPSAQARRFSVASNPATGDRWRTLHPAGWYHYDRPPNNRTEPPSSVPSPRPPLSCCSGPNHLKRA